MSEELELYKQAYEREREARIAAEAVVERRSRELFKKNQELEKSVSELQGHQDAIIQFEKLASLGTLISGVAHEINNPLAFVTANVESLTTHAEQYSQAFAQLVEQLQQADPDSELLARIYQQDLHYINAELPSMMQDTQEGVGRVVEIVQSLKSFGRMDRASRVPADLNEGIRSTLKLLQHELKESITVDLKLSELPMVKCNPGEINQVFLNIMMNAVHALKDTAKAALTVESKVTQQSVDIRITDNGCGMDESVLSRLFEPFYTTKPVGEGTGLGLSIAYKIIEEHAGSLSVESRIGSGTCFTISIPLIE